MEWTVIERSKKIPTLLTEEMNVAIEKNDVLNIKKLISNFDDVSRTFAFIVALYKGKRDVCRIIQKFGIICDIRTFPTHTSRMMHKAASEAEEVLQLDWLIPPTNYGMDHATPLVDALRRQYFDIAEEIFKTGYCVDLLEDGENNVLYEMLLSCNDLWLERIFKMNCLLGTSSLEFLDSILLDAIADDSNRIYQWITSTYKERYEASKEHEFLLKASEQGSVKIFNYIVNKRPALISSQKLIHQIVYSILGSKTHTSPSRSRLFKTMCVNDLSNSNHFTQYENPSQSVDERKGLILSLILHSILDVNYQDKQGNSLLHFAVLCNNTFCVEVLLKHGAKINVFNNRKQTPLYFSRSVEMTRVLLKENPEIDILDIYNISPLEKMLPQDQYWLIFNFVSPDPFASAFEIIQKYPDPLIYNLKSKLKRFLTLAYENNSIWLLKHMIKKSKCYNDNSKIIGEIVFNIIEKDNSLRVINRFRSDPELETNNTIDMKIEMLTLLCQEFDDINYINKDGQNALHYALFFELPFDIIKLLVDRNVNVNKPDLNGITPIFYAYNIEIFNFLVSSGANINVRDKSGCTPFIAAILRCQNAIANVLFNTENEHYLSKNHLLTCFTASAAFYIHNVPLDSEIYDFLIKNGMDFIGKDIEGIHYLHRAWRDGNAFFIKEYMSRDLDINLTDDLGNTLLFYTEFCDSKFNDIMSQMIISGLDLNKRNKSGQTCIHYLLLKEMSADEKRQFRIEKQTFDPTADYRGKSLSNVTLFEEGYSHFSSQIEECIIFLMKHGANINLLDGLGRNVLHYIAMNEGLDPFFRHLKKYFNTSEFNRRDNSGKTPLHLLLERETGAISKKVLVDILNAGANPNILDLNGESSFDYLGKRTDPNITDLREILNNSMLMNYNTIH